MKRAKFTVAVTFFSLLLTACSVTKPGFVQRQWRSNMEELGVYAKFPPSEDVKVGDVYLLSDLDANTKIEAAKDLGSELKLGMLLASVADKNAISQHYAERYAYEASSASKVVSIAAVSAGALTPTSASQPLSAVTVPQHMRRVAFPQFFKLQLDSASLGAVVPIGAVASALGVSGSAFDSASVTVEDAGSTALPLAGLLARMIDDNGKLEVSRLGFTTISQARAALAATADGTAKDSFAIFLINEVFYARTFDISLNASASSGLNLSPVNGSAVVGGSGQAVTLPSSGDGLANAAARASDEVNKSSTISVPSAGYSLQLGRYSENRVGLTKTYDRYVAIGFRGIKLFVKASDLSVRSSIGAPATPLDVSTPLSGEQPKKNE